MSKNDTVKQMSETFHKIDVAKPVAGISRLDEVQ
jgi:hypothetical protein